VTVRSAGIVLYCYRDGELRVLLLHPGGPFWARRDEGAWSIPKGEYGADEEPLQAAQREFLEETGAAVHGPFLPLDPIRQRSGKIVTAWAAAGEFDTAALRSNPVTLEWPARSGRLQQFPEVDRAGWFTLAQARQKILPAQVPLLDQLAERLRGAGA